MNFRRHRDQLYQCQIASRTGTQMYRQLAAAAMSTRASGAAISPASFPR